MNPQGADAEAIAVVYLQQHGLILLEKNYTCRFGEIDIVMRDGKTLVFVEVRLRSNSSFGGAGMSITTAKQQKLIRTAQHYLQQHGSNACRFDAVLMTRADNSQVEWIKNAFEA